jgi:hypothetical protein
MYSPSLFHVGGESEHDCQSHEKVENQKFHFRSGGKELVGGIVSGEEV